MSKHKEVIPPDRKSTPLVVRDKTRSGRTDKRKAVSQKLILDATEQLMREEGYAAVSTRRVAKKAGLKAPLVHYHFATTDDLFIALFRREVVGELQKLDMAASSPECLRNIWLSYQNPERTAIAVEFMALANHRSAIKDEFARYTELARRQRAKVLEGLLQMDQLEPKTCSGEGLAVLLIGVARTLVQEKGLGISIGHDEANAFVEWWLDRLKK